MSSINLLPEHIKLRNKLSDQRNVILVILFFLAPVSIVSYLGVYFDKSSASDKTSLLDFNLEILDEDIKREINKSNPSLLEEKVKDITLLLDEHYYYSKAFRLVQGLIVDNVYLTSSDFSMEEENLILDVKGSAKDYPTAVEQIAILKNSYWLEDVEFDNIAVAGEGEVSFSAKMKLKKDLVLYHKNYWDFGLTLLSSKIDRYLKIDEYSAVLKETADQNSLIEIKFSGVAYDEKKLESLENNLKEIEIVKEASVSYNSNKEENLGVIEFNGEIKLSL